MLLNPKLKKEAEEFFMTNFDDDDEIYNAECIIECYKYQHEEDLQKIKNLEEEIEDNYTPRKGVKMYE